MHEITRLLNSMENTEASSEDLLPLLYAELRQLAAQKMSGEASGHTLQPTALVHEAWMRLGGDGVPKWQSRAHFFGAAAEAMRRILVEHARRKKRQKRGGGAEHEVFNETAVVLAVPPDELLAVNEALDVLAGTDPMAAELVKLRYFVGMTMEQSASALGLPIRTAERLWTFARAWLRREIRSRM
jgi:RNA polymerase sigma factor (TIGR02999 family)